MSNLAAPSASTAFMFLFTIIAARVPTEELLQEIGIKTTPEPGGSNGLHTLTVWFKQYVYQCTLNPINDDTEYTCDASSFIAIGCDTTSNIDGAKILFDNSGSDHGSVLSRIWIKTNVATYGIKGLCVSDSKVSSIGQYLRDNKMDGKDGLCGSRYTHFSDFCVDNETPDNSGGSCAPERQVLHFDTTRPGEDIENALWEDGTNVVDPTCTPADCVTPSDGDVDTCLKQSQCVQSYINKHASAPLYSVCLLFLKRTTCTKKKLAHAEQCTYYADLEEPPQQDPFREHDFPLLCYTAGACTDVIFNVQDGNCNGDRNQWRSHVRNLGNSIIDHATISCEPQQGNGCDPGAPKEKENNPPKEPKDKDPKEPKDKDPKDEKPEKEDGPCRWTITTPGCTPSPTTAANVNGDVGSAANAKDAVSNKNDLMGFDSNGNVSAAMFIVLGGIVVCVLLIALGVFIYCKVFKSKKEKIANEEMADIDVIVEEGVNENEKDEEVAVTQTTA